MLKNNKRNKGFTLAELLIVVAIVGVLAAIGISVFSSQLEKSREAADIANLRSAKAAAITKYLADDTTHGTYYFDAQKGVLVSETELTTNPIVGYGKGTNKNGSNANSFALNDIAYGAITISWVDTDGSSNDNSADYASNSNVSGQIVKVVFDNTVPGTPPKVYNILDVDPNKLTELNSIDGKNNIINGMNNVSFRSEADFNKFLLVTLNDEVINESNYTVTEGSTIVTLKKEFVNTLAVGDYTMNIVSNDGKATIYFSVEEFIAATFNDGTSLTWNELKDPANGTKYGYNTNSITDNSINNRTFYNCDSLISINLPDSVIKIGDYAFYSCNNLKNINMYGNVKTIGQEAFRYCNGFLSFTIPDSVTSIGENAFYNCMGLKSVTIGSGVTTMGGWVFASCSNLTNVTIKEGVTIIGEAAFIYCSNLQSITIPDSVIKIEEHALQGCKSLSSVAIPDSVTTIGYRAFCDCSNLNDITISNNVTIIGMDAFYGCKNLTNINIPARVTSIGRDAFNGCNKLSTITVDENNQNYSFADGILFNKDKTTLIVYLHSKMNTSYTIPNGVTSIGNYAFSGCKKLTSITIPNSVTSIGEGAFCGCSSLTSIEIPNSIRTISRQAFEYCKNLTNVTLNNGVTNIGGWAFSRCDNLTSITIPNSITTINLYAFVNCTSLTSINYEGTREQWSNNPIKTITFANDWDYNTSNYTIHCANGDLCKTHTYVETTKEPNCTEAGFIKQTCSVCGYVNTVTIPVQHNFVDSVCSSCGTGNGKSFNSATSVSLGSYTATIESDNYVYTSGSNRKLAIYKFVAPATKTYTFMGTGTPGDTYGYLFNSSQSQIKYDDDSGGNSQFKISHACTAGETYYLGVAFYSSSNTGNIPFSISE